MKKSAATLTLALGIMVLSIANVQANNPTRLSAEVDMIHSELTMEKKIVVEEWMLSFEAQQIATEKNINLEGWMINVNWNDNTDLVVEESNIELEDWMTKSFTPAISVGQTSNRNNRSAKTRFSE